jgi:hypothetical protein
MNKEIDINDYLLEEDLTDNLTPELINVDKKREVKEEKKTNIIIEVDLNTNFDDIMDILDLSDYTDTEKD